MKDVFDAIREAFGIIWDLASSRRLAEKVPPQIEHAMKEAYAESEEARRLDALRAAATDGGDSFPNDKKS